MNQVANTVRSLPPTARWVFRKEIKAATTRCGCISLMPTLEAIARAQYKHAKRLHLKGRASPYDHSQHTKSRAHREHSDRARNSLVIHMTRTCSHEHSVKGPHNNVYAKAFVQ